MEKQEIVKRKQAFGKFADTLKRWYGVAFDEVTMHELEHKSISESFTITDYTWCLNSMAAESARKYKFLPIDVYRLCKESKLRRLKDDRDKETSKRLSAPINKEGRERVKMYLSRITGNLNRNRIQMAQNGLSK